MSPVVLFEKNYSKKKIVVVSEFKASLAIIWEAFTNPAIIDKWWAPKPYKTETKEFDFTNEGQWLHSMVSPKGERHWNIADFSNIQPMKSYDFVEAFCDENGTINKKFPHLTWHNSFSEDDGETMVINTITGEEADLQRIIEIGFEEGYKMALNQLNELI